MTAQEPRKSTVSEPASERPASERPASERPASERPAPGRQVNVEAGTADLWGAGLQPAGCPACHQTFLVPEASLSRPCPHCAQGSLQPQPAILRREPAELGVPFALSPGDLQGRLDEFVRSVWLRPDDFTVEHLQSRLTAYYWPMWLVDAGVTGNWQAELGFDYQVKSSQEKYINGQWRSQENVETRIRWEPRMGSLVRSYANIAVPALIEHKAMTQAIGSYRLDNAVPWQVQAETAIQVPDLQPDYAWPLAQERLEQIAAEDCRQAASGQHIRNFKLKPSYDQQHWTLLLLPAYSTYYSGEDGQVHPITIHGQTGQIHGVRMASQRKGWLYGGILAAAAVVLFLLAMLLFALVAVFPPAGVLAPLLVLLAFLVGAAALAPVVWPWQWNRRQQANRPD